MTSCLNAVRSLRANVCLNQSRASSINWLQKRKCANTSQESKTEEIIIPTRIPRGPTDILQALASTVGRDPTAPHYKYHDDPYLTPTSNRTKRIYALAQESGRKTAHWIRDENRDFFLYQTWDPPTKMKTPHINAEPFIDAFSPRPVYNEDTEVTEEDLKLVMKNSLISDAKTIYNLLVSKNIEISEESLQELVELLCYFNEEDPLPEDWCEERWYQNVHMDNKQAMWKEGGMVQTLFDKIENKPPGLYSAMIQGMCKFYQAEKAHCMYKECSEKNIALNTGVYNSLIKVGSFLKDSFDLRWEFVLEILNDMNSKGVKPDLGTLNSCLHSLSQTTANVSNKERALMIFSEFVNKCQIEPSLATWYYMMNIFCRDKGPKCDLLYTIINNLSGTELTIRDPMDTHFFVTAMTICRHYHDIALANKLHDLLLHESNYNLIGDSYKESVYYRHYFIVNCRYQPHDVFMEFYNQLVPHVYCPEPTVMEDIIKAVDTNGAVEHLPLIWSHIVMFGHTNRLTIIQMVIRTMINHLPAEDSDKLDPETDKPKTIEDAKTMAEAVALEIGNKQFGDESKQNLTIQSMSTIAWDIWNKIEEQGENSRNELCWTGAMLGDVMQILMRAGKMEEAHTVLQKLSTGYNVIGVPSSHDQIIEFAKACIKEKKPSYVVSATKYLSDNSNIESTVIAKEALQVFLNKSLQETEEAIANIISSKPKILSEDPHISSLLSVASQIGVAADKPIEKTEEETTSSSSSDDESSDEESLEENK